VNSGNRVLDSTAVSAAFLVAVAVFAVLVLGRLAPAGSSAGAGGAPARVPANPSSSAAAVAGSFPAPASNRPGGTNTTSVACDSTRPDPVFRAPRPAPAEPPAYYHASWYGSAHLWTMLDTDGRSWRGLPQSAAGLTQKTFWWSADWAPGDEPEPAITVTGRRLDGHGSFSFGPGTNASADFGTAMLVGVDVPTTGCWEITGRYRTSTLSFIVSVEDPQPS
jgi:hypothetical protein